jgi:hypothetical protein
LRRAATRSGAAVALAVALLMLACSEPASTSVGANGWLAFVRADQLVVADPGGSAARSLGPIDPEARPVWSPNGQIIAFVRNGTVWTTRADGAPREQSLARAVAGSAMAWSPGGGLLAYVADPGGHLELLDIVTGAVTPAYRDGAEVDGWWNPRELDGELFLARSDATRQVALVDAGAAGERTLLEADWTAPAPADERVAYSDGGRLLVWTPFTRPVVLAEGSSAALGARWSPSGDRLAVTRSDDEGAIIYVVNPADGTAHSLGSGTGPSWRADGLALALERDGEVVVVATADGVEEWRAPGAAPAWQPEMRFEFAGPPPATSTVEPRNLIGASRSFELDAGGWITTGDNLPLATRVETDSVRGNAAVEVQFGGVNSVFAAPQTAEKEVLDGLRVTFSAWVRTDDACAHLVHQADGATILSGAEQSAPHPGDGEWHRLSLSLTATYDTTAPTTFIDFGMRCDGTATALIDAAQLEFGLVASDFEAGETDALSALPRGQPVALP